MTNKGCLKVSPLPSRSGSPTPTTSPAPKKCVSWCSHLLENVFEADDWDRTPHEPVKSLSYQDALELKSIQRSLPYADQPPDPLTGRPGSSRLQKVPLTLLPLLSESTPGDDYHLSSGCPTTSLSSTSSPGIPPTQPHSAFRFLPLSDEAESSSSCVPSLSSSQASQGDLTPPANHYGFHSEPAFQPRQGRRRKKVFEINGMEFEMSDEEEDISTIDEPPGSSPPAPAKKQVMFINGEEVELSDDDDAGNEDPVDHEECEERDDVMAHTSYPSSCGTCTDEEDDLIGTSSTASTSQISTPPSSPPPSPPQELPDEKTQNFIHADHCLEPPDRLSTPIQARPPNKLRGRMPLLPLL